MVFLVRIFDPTPKREVRRSAYSPAKRGPSLTVTPHPTRELAYYAELQERALAWIRTHPREYLALVAGRLRYFLFPDDFAGRRYAYPVWAATVLSFLGLGLMLLRQRRAALVILLAAGLYSSVYILVSSMNWRYRQPTYPLTTLAAGYLLWEGIRRRPGSRTAAGSGR